MQYPIPRLLSGAAVAAACAIASVALAHGDEHAMHAMHAQPGSFTVKSANYTVPAIKLVRDDGREVLLASELDDGRPVFLNFIYTTCTTICPLMSQSLAQLQQKLGADAARVHFVSISIDPEQDTPERLRAYAAKFGAGPQWQHYTGTVNASVAAQRTFGAYQGDKMAHDPLTLVRWAPGMPWTRIDGFATGQELYEQYARLSHAMHSR